MENECANSGREIKNNFSSFEKTRWNEKKVRVCFLANCVCTARGERDGERGEIKQAFFISFNGL